MLIDPLKKGKRKRATNNDPKGIKNSE